MTNTPHEPRNAPRLPPDDAARPPHTPGSRSAGKPLREGYADAHPAPSAPVDAQRPGTAVTDSGTAHSASGAGGTASPVDPSLDKPVKRGVSGTVWAALILGVIVLILLLVFIIQNNVATRFEYMAWTFSLPLGVAMLLSAIAGALIMALVGSVRMFSLGHRVRKLERERERIRTSLHG